MPTYLQLALSGLDRVGKNCQAKLLHRVLTPSQLFSFPQYTHWSGRLIRAILNEKPFTISLEPGSTTTHLQEKEPYLFQALQFAGLRAFAPQIQAARAGGHVVLDRGPECALAYGLVDGCCLEFLLALQQQQPPSDLVLCLVGRPNPRPGEIPDANERDLHFQERVGRAYQGLCQLFPRRFALLATDDYRDPDPGRSIWQVHRAVVALVNPRLPKSARVQPLSLSQVRAEFGLVPAQPNLPGTEG